jgi:hypothetical protein
MSTQSDMFFIVHLLVLKPDDLDWDLYDLGEKYKN